MRVDAFLKSQSPRKVAGFRKAQAALPFPHHRSTRMIIFRHCVLQIAGGLIPQVSAPPACRAFCCAVPFDGFLPGHQGWDRKTKYFVDMVHASV